MKFLKLFLVLLIFSQIESKFQKLNCEVFVKSYAEFNKCQIKAVNRSKNLINVLLTFKESGNNSDVQLYFLKRGNGYGWQPYLYNIQFNFCDFLKNRQPLIPKLVFLYIKPYANFNKTCPMPGSVVKLTNFDLNVDTLRQRFPFDQGEYALVINWFANKKLMFTVNGSIIYSDYKV